MTTCCEHIHINSVAHADPSRTAGIRARFIADVNRRFQRLINDIKESIIDNDCFGIQVQFRAHAALPHQAFVFEQDTQRLALFMEWLQEQESNGILYLISGKDSWANMYIDSAYQRGLRNADSWLKRTKAGGSVTAKFPSGVRQVVQMPIHAARVSTIYSRIYDELKTVTNVMNAEIRTKLAEALREGLARGFAEGKNPLAIARELNADISDRIEKIGIARARTIARTEVMNAHNTAVDGEYAIAEQIIGEPIMVDILLGGNPCPICIDLEAGGPYDRAAAIGQLPAHPNCVCVHIPVIENSKGEK